MTPLPYDLEWFFTQMSRARPYLTLNISETVRDRDIITIEYYLGFTHSLLRGVILSDLEWLSEIFNDKKHRAASLRQLSFFFVYCTERRKKCVVKQHTTYVYYLRTITLFCWKRWHDPCWATMMAAICDFQGRDGWRARKSDNRWGAGTARRLKRDKVVKIAGLGLG